MNRSQGALRFARMSHGILLFAAVLYVFVPQLLHAQERIVSSVLVYAFGAVCVTNIALAFYFRSRMLRPAEETLRTDSENEATLGRWRAGVLLSLTLALSVALFGLALKFIGAGWNVAGIFYAAGILLLLAWTPRLDVPSQG